MLSDPCNSNYKAETRQAWNELENLVIIDRVGFLLGRERLGLRRAVNAHRIHQEIPPQFWRIKIPAQAQGGEYASKQR
jgi:hypothetical protein